MTLHDAAKSIIGWHRFRLKEDESSRPRAESEICPGQWKWESRIGFLSFIQCAHWMSHLVLVRVMILFYHGDIRREYADLSILYWIISARRFGRGARAREMHQLPQIPVGQTKRASKSDRVLSFQHSSTIYRNFENLYQKVWRFRHFFRKMCEYEHQINENILLIFSYI